MRKRFGRGCKPRPAFEETFRTGLQTPSGKQKPRPANGKKNTQVRFRKNSVKKFSLAICDKIYYSY
ncbi:Uncharacterized protein dnm_016990 [Desulfonema magnum]|uniref:Uncharacterized protein n=1 Tax=Desulfonema magnum TaxID=45655 RepID=A0A975BI17_9BACT|nr:Uncharacterized protein dnm_016990 [Desulfonema magnum]